MEYIISGSLQELFTARKFSCGNSVFPKLKNTQRSLLEIKESRIAFLVIKVLPPVEYRKVLGQICGVRKFHNFSSGVRNPKKIGTFSWCANSHTGVREKKLWRKRQHLPMSLGKYQKKNYKVGYR